MKIIGNIRILCLNNQNIQKYYLKIHFECLIDVHTMKVQLIMTFFAAQPSDKCKVSDAQQVVVLSILPQTLFLLQ